MFLGKYFWLYKLSETFQKTVYFFEDFKKLNYEMSLSFVMRCFDGVIFCLGIDGGGVLRGLESSFIKS
jgi:hypothetical protein